MERKPYSHNYKIFRLSRAIIISMIIGSILGFFLMLGAYNSYIQIWIVHNAHGTSPVNPINPSQSSSSIPYFSIFITNIITILFIPLALIMIFNLVLIQTKRIAIKKETSMLFQSLGLQQSGSMTAFISLEQQHKLTIIGNYDGSFTLSMDDSIYPNISGDELLWKIHYLNFKVSHM